MQWSWVVKMERDIRERAHLHCKPVYESGPLSVVSSQLQP